LTKNTYDLQKKLESWLGKPRKVVIAGIGNSIRMDDFVGVKIVKDLRGKIPENVRLIECETVPESFMDEIVELKPSHVLLIDAAIIGLKPGDVRLVFPEQIEVFPAITTHALPLRIFCELITQSTKAKIGLLLIQPGHTEFGEGLTVEVASAAEQVVESLLNVL
jgi:hydrogenase 3 maturation protease